MSTRILVMFCFSCILALGAAPLDQASGQLVIHNQSNKVYSGLNITTTKKEKDCIQIINSTNITIQNSQIGPCGGNGIHIYNNTAQSSQIYIYDSYIHPETHTTNCCDNNDGIFVQDGVSQVTVQGNVIAYGESNVEVLGSGWKRRERYDDHRKLPPQSSRRAAVFPRPKCFGLVCEQRGAEQLL